MLTTDVADPSASRPALTVVDLSVVDLSGGDVGRMRVPGAYFVYLSA